VKSTVTPWRVFFEALSKQRPSVRESWLRRWLFSNEGAIMSMARE
jgi:hypothetical protein